jgi:hypothetical protein
MLISLLLSLTISKSNICSLISSLELYTSESGFILTYPNNILQEKNKKQNRVNVDFIFENFNNQI